MPGRTVGAALDPVHAAGPGPRSITVDHGTAFMSRALEDWANQRDVQLNLIPPGNPWKMPSSSRFNGRLRDEYFGVYQFASIADAKAKIETWRVDYNQRRPARSLGYLTPDEYARQRQISPTAEAASL